MNSDKRLFLIFIFSAVIAAVPLGQAAFCQDSIVSEQEELKPEACVGSVIRSVRVTIEGRPCRKTSIEQMARDLIALHEGDTFSIQKYSQSLESLNLSESFEQIRPSISRDAGGLDIVFALKPALVIRDIKLKGEYPVFTSDVLKSMTTYPGDTLLPNTIPEHEVRIGDLFKREGYIHPKVTISDEPDEASGTTLMKVNIDRGPYYVLDDVAITGASGMSETEIKMRLKAWRSSLYFYESGRFREHGFDQDIKNLTSQYWKRGYPECEIHSEIAKDAQKASVRIKLDIAEGPHYKIAFSGNKRFWSMTLRNDLAVFRQGNRHDRGLRKSIEAIKRRYSLAGYQFTEINVVENKEYSGGHDVRNIILVITEGPRTSVGSLSFTGCRAFDEKELVKIIKSADKPMTGKNDYVPELLDIDVDALKAFYIREGYNGVKVTPSVTLNDDKTAANIALSIEEGIKTTVKSLEIKGLTTLSKEKAGKPLDLKDGKAFSQELLKYDETTLANEISDTGHPYVSVKSATSFTEDRSGVDVAIDVDEGKAVSMGNIYYTGNLKTRERVLDRELGIKPGDAFSLKDMLKGQKNIRDMGIFRSVQFKTIGLKEKEDKITLLVDMEEPPPYYYQAGIGYTSYQGFYGNARAGDRNMFGLNSDGWVGGEISQIGYNGQVNINQRRFFGTKLSTTYSASYESKEDFNQPFGVRDLAFAVTFLKEFAPRHVTTSLGFKYDRREQFPKDSSTVTDDSYLPRGIFTITPGAAYDGRDSFVRPTKGIYSSLYIDVSKGRQNSMDNFLKYRFNIRGYLHPLQWLTFAATGSAGYIDPYNTNSTIPADQLLYLGGTMTVRGFSENMLRYDSNDNPVGGRLTLNGSAEARIDLTHNIEAEVFFDIGSVQEPVTYGGSDAFRSSVGLGLSYITPVGPIGICYGLKTDPYPGESPGCFHFSIGYTF